MADERDPPIEEPGFIAGVNVVDIGDVRVARGLTRRHHSSCPHHRLMYDDRERRVWCKDCERDVESFDAFKIIVENLDKAIKSVERREKAITEAEQFKLRTLAAKAMDQAWRSTKMVPACPNCGGGLFPEQFKNGVCGMLGRDYAQAMADRKKRRTDT